MLQLGGGCPQPGLERQAQTPHRIPCAPAAAPPLGLCARALPPVFQDNGLEPSLIRDARWNTPVAACDMTGLLTPGTQGCTKLRRPAAPSAGGSRPPPPITGSRPVAASRGIARPRGPKLYASLPRLRPNSRPSRTRFELWAVANQAPREGGGAGPQLPPDVQRQVPVLCGSWLESGMVVCKEGSRRVGTTRQWCRRGGCPPARVDANPHAGPAGKAVSLNKVVRSEPGLPPPAKRHGSRKLQGAAKRPALAAEAELSWLMLVFASRMRAQLVLSGSWRGNVVLSGERYV